MKITRISKISGVQKTLEIPCTPAQYADWLGGTLIQNAMPNLSPADREFVMNGITQEEWDEIFGKDSE
jgi:hypothetical protein